MKYINTINSLFGEAYLENALAYNYSISSRFELNDGGTYIQMFLESFERFKAILNCLYPKKAKFVVATCFYEPKKLVRKLPDGLKKLRQQDFNLPKQYQRLVSYDADWETYVYVYLFEIDIWSPEFNIIVWNILGGDLGIEPSCEISSYFFDLENQILIHPYDDRGVDIVAKKKGSLSQINKKFKKYKMEIN